MLRIILNIFQEGQLPNVFSKLYLNSICFVSVTKCILTFSKSLSFINHLSYLSLLLPCPTFDKFCGSSPKVSLGPTYNFICVILFSGCVRRIFFSVTLSQFEAIFLVENMFSKTAQRQEVFPKPDLFILREAVLWQVSKFCKGTARALREPSPY